jgi:hypothetical protein
VVDTAVVAVVDMAVAVAVAAVMAAVVADDATRSLLQQERFKT